MLQLSRFIVSFRGLQRHRRGVKGERREVLKHLANPRSTSVLTFFARWTGMPQGWGLWLLLRGVGRKRGITLVSQGPDCMVVVTQGCYNPAGHGWPCGDKAVAPPGNERELCWVDPAMECFLRPREGSSCRALLLSWHEVRGSGDFPQDFLMGSRPVSCRWQKQVYPLTS